MGLYISMQMRWGDAKNIKGMRTVVEGFRGNTGRWGSWPTEEMAEAKMAIHGSQVGSRARQVDAEVEAQSIRKPSSVLTHLNALSELKSLSEPQASLKW